MAEPSAEERIVTWKLYQAIYWWRRKYILFDEAVAQIQYWGEFEKNVARLFLQANRELTLKELAGFRFRPPLFDDSVMQKARRTPNKHRRSQKGTRRRKPSGSGG